MWHIPVHVKEKKKKKKTNRQKIELTFPNHLIRSNSISFARLAQGFQGETYPLTAAGNFLPCYKRKSCVTEEWEEIWKY